MLIETAENGRYEQVYTGIFNNLFGLREQYRMLNTICINTVCINRIRHQNIWLYCILLCRWTVAYGRWVAEYC